MQNKQLFTIPSTPDVTETNWQPILKTSAGGHANLFDEMAMRATFSIIRSPSTMKLKKSLRFRIGKGVMREMGWEIGDKVLVCYDKDDTHSLMFIKNENGFKLAYETVKKYCGVISLPADFLKCEAFSTITQTYKIDKKGKRLFMRLKSEIILGEIK